MRTDSTDKGKSKILIIGPAWVGDMVMAQTLFMSLKARHPENELHVLAPPWTHPLLARMPEVARAIELPLKHGELGLKTRYRIAQSLKAQNYDESIVLPNSWKSALIPWFTGIPKRTGYKGECRYGLLNDVRILDKKLFPKMIEQFAALAYPKGTAAEMIKEYLPFPALAVSSDSLEKTCEKFKLLASANVFSSDSRSSPIQNPKHLSKPILAICPGAEFGPSKRWPEHHYANVANAKLAEGWEVFLFGSRNDEKVCDKIQSLTNSKCLNFTGRTSLGEAIDLLSLASLVLTNDSGLMHIAAALNKPLVAVYGSTSPAFTPPLHPGARIVRNNLPCSPCFKRECPLKHHRCMEDLKPATVLEELSEAGACYDTSGLPGFSESSKSSELSDRTKIGMHVDACVDH